MTKCRHDYFWLHAGVREIRDYLYIVDLGICVKCHKATSRVKVASPGDQVSAMMWGESRFEPMRREELP